MPSTASASSDTAETLNKFSALTIYEPSEAFLNAPDIERPEKVGEEDTIYEAELPQSLEDALLHFSMLLGDLESIRHFISHAWSSFFDEPDMVLAKPLWP